MQSSWQTWTTGEGVNEANFRRTARYIAAEMTVNARHQFAVPGQLGVHLFPGPDTKVVLFRLPIGPNGSRHNAIVLANMDDIKPLISICHYLPSHAVWNAGARPIQPRQVQCVDGRDQAKHEV